MLIYIYESVCICCSGGYQNFVGSGNHICDGGVNHTSDDCGNRTYDGGGPHNNDGGGNHNYGMLQQKQHHG